MKLIKFIFSKVFLINIIIAFVLLAILIFVFFKGLKIITHHGESLTVPDLTGMEIVQVDRILTDRNLRYVINDSIYIENLPVGSVVDQNPSSYSYVKRNRTIYLTINTDSPPSVPLPNIIDVSLRQAVRILETWNIRIGELIYKPDMAQNVVLGMEMNGRELYPGDSVYKGSEIDLILGDGLAAKKVEIPDLTGLNIEYALFVLRANGLNLGLTFYDDGADSLQAVIYNQSPLPDKESKVSQGEAINIYLTDPSNFNPSRRDLWQDN